MSKRSVFTTVTALPAGITRETVMETLHCHVEMIDLNPLVEERHPIKPPPSASAEEFHCQWYSLTDRVQYLPGGMMSGKVNYTACFHDLAEGIQTKIYAPLGLTIRGKWTLGGSLPGEPIAPVELGLGTPMTGLWLREDVDMKCNFMMTTFVKGTIKKSHATLVDRLLVKAQIQEASLENLKLSESLYAPQGPASYTHNNEYRNPNSTDSQTPPPYHSHSYQSHGSFTGSTAKPESRYYDDDDESLHPKPLSIRSSNSTVGGSQNGEPSYGEQASAKVSWQSLNPGAREPARTNRIPLPSNPAEFRRAHQRQESWQRGHQTVSLQAPCPPPKSQTFELEA